MAKFVKLQDGLACCGNGRNAECLNIGPNILDCYIRSAPALLKHCSLGRREQMNIATAFIDAGPIYQNLKDSSKEEIASSFTIGTSPTKSSLHDLLVDEHNWAADQLLKKFPDMSVELIFEEARKFLIAEIQHITFEHFLPLLLGEETMVQDVDLILLGIAENPVYGSLLGPTFGCIMALQFQKVYHTIILSKLPYFCQAKFGDSYWYTNRLSQDQLEEVQKVSISGMICRHQKASIIQKDSFKEADNFSNIPLFCNSSVFSTPDFSRWITTTEKLRNSQFDYVLGECILKISEEKRNQKSQNLREGFHNSVALKSYGSMMLAKDEAVVEANISFILLEATRSLVKQENMVLDRIQGVYIGEDFGKKSDDQCNPKDYPCDPTNPYRCDSSRTVSASCFPIPVPSDDLHFEPFSCLSFVRSLPAQKTLGYRNQMNQVSSYLDGSVMYGSTKCEGDRLRTFQDGKMKTTQISKTRRHYGITISQSDEAEQDGCVSSPEFPCFIAGDDRNSQQALLIAVHTVFHREHDRIATLLKEINSEWDDERIYQETRKLISAQFAHIVYNEYLPIIIGQKFIDDNELRPLKDGFYEGYKNCDASILQPFATAAFRFGHSTVTRFTPMQETIQSPATKVVDLASDFLNMTKVYETEAIEQILGGMHGRHQMMTDRFIDDAVRAFCGLSRLTSFYSIFSDIDQDGLTEIGKVYESPDDIDLFTGIVSEKPVPGGIVGPTAACIIAEQFKRLKQCDRFYYENGLDYARFSIEQLKEIRKVTMSSMICVNTKVPKLSKDVFSVPDSYAIQYVSCNAHTISEKTIE
uniref:Animal hem peroxidase n=1 Tax=Caenorhabditis tropicalis TaxID=1561998 RepID=A0A1I7TG21_9PELO